jgi:large repetitive protein
MRFARVLLLVSLIALVATPAALAIRFADSDFNLPLGQTGKTYSFQLTATGGCGPALPYQWTLLNGSALPPGLTLDFGGLIHGTPTTAGDYSFWVNLSDQNPPSASWCRPAEAQRQLFIKVVQGLSIVQRQSALTPAQLNTPYNNQLSVSGQNGAILTWSIASGALPTGLTLNSSTGLISGTPTALGDSSFQIKVTDGNRQDTQSYTLAVVNALKITSPAAAAAEVGRPFQYTLTAEGGKSGYSWSATGVPTGLNLDGATGAITGTPTTAGVANIQVTVKDSIGLTQTIDLKLVVAAELQLVKRALPSAKTGRSYHAHLYVSGGVSPKRWTIIGGALPAGIHLNARTGALTGTPRHAGTAHIYVSVRDKLGAISRATFKLSVH